jgi:hypothetical protein
LEKESAAVGGGLEEAELFPCAGAAEEVLTDAGEVGGVGDHGTPVGDGGFEFLGGELFPGLLSRLAADHLALA